TIFGTSGLHVGPATFGPGAFSGLLLAGSFPVAPYSLTEIVSIHFAGPGVTSFDTELRVVPEPATLTLLGLGVLGLGACAWRRRKGEASPTRGSLSPSNPFESRGPGVILGPTCVRSPGRAIGAPAWLNDRGRCASPRPKPGGRPRGPREWPARTRGCSRDGPSGEPAPRSAR